MEAKTNRLITFLQEDLGLPTEAIALGLQQCDQSLNLLPMVLWQYGLVTLGQLDRIFDWLEAYPTLLMPKVLSLR
jgi:hypothetical protein